VNVMVAVASRHGRTREIGDRIGAVLYDAGFDVHVTYMTMVVDLGETDAVILGSGVSMGKWESTARRFVDTFFGELGSIPVWIFSSGSIARDERRNDESAILALGPIDSRIFVGDPDPHKLSMHELFACRLLRVPDDDVRDWDDIDRWTTDIAGALVEDRAKPVGRHAS